MLARTVARLTSRQGAQRALQAIARAPALTRLQRLRRREFEACVCELERCEGSRVRRARRFDGTRGLYLVVRPDGARTVLCCKHWPHARAGTNELRCLREQMHAVHASAGVLVTCGELSEELSERDTGTIALIDGRALLARIERYAGSRPGRNAAKDARHAGPVRRKDRG
jgi:hypothetical protein